MPDSAAKSDRATAAEIVLPCAAIPETLSFFTDELGFRVDSIYPADAPRVAVISGFGVRLRLDREASGDPATVRLIGSDFSAAATRRAPNGTRVEFVPAEASLALPENSPSLVVLKAADGPGWGTGRAGMQYRDLIPDRYGGRFIASHIRIAHGGPVPDYVHHHHIHFQMIYCVNGWVRVVYEDQGPPMLMEAGDCFLQPPHIRHRVLECSDRMEVVEFACPAEHETRVDHDMQLPTTVLAADRVFDGQRFVFHRAEGAAWRPWHADGFEFRDTRIGAATNGVATVVVVRASAAAGALNLDHEAEIRFLFVLRGSASLHCDDAERGELVANDAAAIPPGLQCSLTDISPDFEFLEVTLPA